MTKEGLRIRNSVGQLLSQKSGQLPTLSLDDGLESSSPESPSDSGYLLSSSNSLASRLTLRLCRACSKIRSMCPGNPTIRTEEGRVLGADRFRPGADETPIGDLSRPRRSEY